MTKRLQEEEAKHGQKMIEIKVRFWTNDIATGKDKIVPKHARGSGVVRIERNAAHGIAPGGPIPFNSILEVGGAIEKCLIKHNIKLHPSRRMKKYIA